MHILFQHDDILPIQRYGGTERLIFWLMRYLIKIGHRVTLIGHPRSDVKKWGIHLIPQLEKDWTHLIPENVDVIHLFAPLRYPLTVPYLTTIGGNGQPGELFDLNTVFVSQSHALNHNSTSYVQNGIEFEEYSFNPAHQKRSDWNHFIFLAKANWKVKNLAQSITAARHCSKHLHIAGGRYWGISRFIHSYGMVDQLQKQKLLAKMDALLFPVRWPEPFGLAIVEAYAYGLPVIGSSFGSLPELITRETGIICHNYEELLEALLSPPRLFDREHIRDHAVKNYSIEVMAQRYLTLYQKVIRGEKLNEGAPSWKGDVPPQTLLPF